MNEQPERTAASKPPSVSQSVPGEPTADVSADGCSEAAPPGSVLRALAAEYPSLPRVHLPEPVGEPPTPVNRPASEQVPQTFPGRYQVSGEIARGGMGAVLRGRDADLGRDVAIKVMLESHKGRAEFVQRFVEEAQVGGQLQHPGIVPVYELGRGPDGRPYFTMKLVKGRTLAQLLRERSDPAHELPRFLGIFEQVCQALAYAHARHVIHRDLKPGNVMVGGFGEVQVMDWGLAKVLRSGEPGAGGAALDEVSVVRTVRSGDSDAAASSGLASGSQTQTGAVLGTPAYMAPEQARGEIDSLDERCDVFGLGAILCVLLTGAPPYHGADGEAIRNRAMAADLADARTRLDGCGADTELIALARRCLAPAREERPRHAGEVAAAMTAYLESVQERLRRAELERAAASARAEEEAKRRQVEAGKAQVERQRRRLTVALSAALMLLVAGGSAAGLWYQHETAEREAEAAQRLALAEQGVRTALERARGLRDGYAKKLAEPGGVFVLLNQPRLWKEQVEAAKEALDRVRALLDGDAADAAAELHAEADELAAQLKQDAADQTLAAALEEARMKKMASSTRSGLDLAAAAADYERLFDGAELRVLQGEVRPIAARLRDSAIRDMLVAALDDWAFCLRTPKRIKTVNRLYAVLRESDPGDDPVRRSMRAPWTKNAVDDLRQLAKKGPPQGLSPHLLYAAGTLLEGEDAIAWLRLAQRRFPGDYWINSHLGALLSMRDATKFVTPRRHEINFFPARKKSYDQVEGVGYLRLAVAIRPEVAHAWRQLASGLYSMSDFIGAEDASWRAIALDAKNASAWVSLGSACGAQGRHEESRIAHERAVALGYVEAWYNLGNHYRLLKQPVKAERCYREVLKSRPRDIPAWVNLGITLHDRDDFAAAVDAYRKALEIDSRFASTWNNLGNALRKQNNDKEAREAYQKALKLDPDFAAAWFNLGNLLADSGKHREAVEAYRKSLAIQENAEIWPNLDVARETAMTWTNLGVALSRLGDLQGSLAANEKAVALDAKFSLAWANLGITRTQLKDTRGGLAALEKAVALDPRNVKAWRALGMTRFLLKDWEGASAAAEKALKLDLKHSAAWALLGDVRLGTNDVRGARDAFEQAVKLGTKDVSAWHNLGNSRYKLGDVPGAVVAYRQATTLAPANGNHWYALSQALQQQRDFGAAAKAAAEAVKHSPKVGEFWSTYGTILHDLRKMPEALAAHRRAQALLPNDARVLYNLGHALLVAKEFSDAVKVLRRSTQLRPKDTEGLRCLAMALASVGEFMEAAELDRKALDLLPPFHRRRAATEAHRAYCLRMQNMDTLLAKEMKGATVSLRQRLELAEFCQMHKKRPAEALRLYEAAFAVEPPPTARELLHHEFFAARAAAQVSRGPGKLADAERARLRGKALVWLRSNLGRWQEFVDARNTAAVKEIPRILSQWQADADLAAVRDPADLAKMTPTERGKWQTFWADVERLRKRASATNRDIER